MKWEVRTMRSGTSFFDWTVFKKTVCRFWPLWGAYSAIWLVMLPLNGLMLLRMSSRSLDDGFSFTSTMEEFAIRHVPQAAANEGCLMLMVVFGVLCAMAVFSHLYNARSANLFGSLPIRREGLFLTHYAAGLAFLLVPNIVIFLLTLLVELAGGVVCWQGLGFWLAATCGEGFFFYSLAVFCAMFTGHILALPAFYAIGNFLVIGVTGLLQIVLNAFYYGFAGLPEGVYNGVKWFTPAVKLAERVRSIAYHLYSGGGPLVLETEGLDVVGIYAVAAAALAVCAFLLYRARRLESAGDVVSVHAMRPVFKYGVAFCAGLALGIGTTALIGGGEVTLIAAIVVWGVIGCFAAQMLLDKSFRVFKKWKGAAAVAAVLLVLSLTVKFDFTGFETRIPDPASVASVDVAGINAAYLGDDGDYLREVITDQSLIELITILHREAVEQRDEERQTQAMLGGVHTTLDLDYALKGGGTVSRRYSLWVDPDQAGREGTAAWALQQLYNNRELYWRAYGFDILEEWLNTPGWRLDQAQYEHYNYEQEYVGDPTEYYYREDARALYEAVKEDFFAGRIGVRTLSRDNGGREYERDIRFVAANEDDGQWSVTIFVQDTASSTLAALERLEQEGAWTASGEEDRAPYTVQTDGEAGAEPTP